MRKATYLFFITIVFALSTSAAFGQVATATKHFNKDEAVKLDETSCTDGFSFAVFADSHLKEDVFGKMRDAAVMMKPDFAVSVGDSTNNGASQEYEDFIASINKTGIPWFVVPGNHEYRNEQGHTSPDGKKRFEKRFGKYDYSFEHCGWKFIMVDIVAMDNMMPNQFRWIEKELKGFEGRAAVFMHYPPAVLEKWKEGYWLQYGKEFLNLLETTKTPLFFSGHLHVHDRLKIGPTAYIVTGGGGGGVDSEKTGDAIYSKDGGPFNHFIYVTVKDGKATDFVVRPYLD